MLKQIIIQNKNKSWLLLAGVFAPCAVMGISALESETSQFLEKETKEEGLNFLEVAIKFAASIKGLLGLHLSVIRSLTESVAVCADIGGTIKSALNLRFRFSVIYSVEELLKLYAGFYTQLDDFTTIGLNSFTGGGFTGFSCHIPFSNVCSLAIGLEFSLSRSLNRSNQFVTLTPEETKRLEEEMNRYLLSTFNSTCVLSQPYNKDAMNKQIADHKKKCETVIQQKCDAYVTHLTSMSAQTQEQYKQNNYLEIKHSGEFEALRRMTEEMKNHYTEAQKNYVEGDTINFVRYLSQAIRKIQFKIREGVYVRESLAPPRDDMRYGSNQAIQFLREYGDVALVIAVHFALKSSDIFAESLLADEDMEELD